MTMIQPDPVNQCPRCWDDGPTDWWCDALGYDICEKCFSFIEPDTYAREKADPVNHPQHYRWLPGDVEVIDITESFGFCLGNVLKYVMRADHKGNPLEDLLKARWYLDRELKRRGHVDD